MKHPNKEIMQRAIDLARKQNSGFTVAAIIVKDDKIISEAVTTIHIDHDATCHAEINAIRKASKILKSENLKDCYLYTTYEPCPMCASASVWAGFKGIVYGASMLDETKQCPQWIKIRCKDVIKKSIFDIKLYPNFMRDECKKLLEI